MGVIDSIIDEALSYANKQKISKVVIGCSATYVELSDGFAGIAYTNSSGSCSGIRPELVGHLKGIRVEDAVQLLESPRSIEVSVGLSVINALLNRPDEDVVEADIMEMMKPQPSDVVGFVGYFGDYTKKLVGRVKDVLVLEVREIEVPGIKVYPWWAFNSFLKSVNKLYITGSSIANHTIEYLLVFSSEIKDKAVIGPSTPLARRTFSKYGVKLLGSSIVINKDLCKNLILEGGSVKDLFRCKCLKKVCMKLL